MDTKKLRQKILDLAIRGKLVPQDPNDEPASVLLERIKAEKERLIKEGKIKRSKKTAKTSDTPHYPYLLPNGWKWCKLEDLVCELKYGTSEKSSSVGKIAVLRMGNITNWGTIDYSGLVYSSNDEDIKQYSLKKNDLLFNRTNSSEWVGKTAVYKEERPAIYAGYLIRVRPILISSDYLNYVMNSSYYRNWCYNVKTDAVNQSNINAQKLSQLMIPVPPLKEQERIIIEIDKWISLIDTIKNSKEKLQVIIKQAKSKILDLAIHGKLVPQDPNEEPASELLKRINSKTEITCDNAHYTNLPAGWAMCKLSDLCKIENGFAFSSDDYKSHGIPLVRISNITHNTIDITDCAYIEGITDDKFKVSKGDLLIAMSGATTGKMGVYPFDETAYLNQRVGNIKILNKSSLYPNYRNTYMQSKVDEILKIAYGGAQPNISASIIGNFDFPLPPYKEQIRIVETVQRIFDQLDVITESL
ncbi:restriction endonuclease subunit S [Bacteroides fragilis]|nr:restriction endonuclease subunit S [Bacteroides fragilis]